MTPLHVKPMLVSAHNVCFNPQMKPGLHAATKQAAIE